MTRIENIREFIHDITNGLVKITDNQAEAIIAMSTTFASGTVSMFIYDSNNSKWHKHRIINVEDARIIAKLNEYSNSINYNLYKYECTLSSGSYAGTIFSSNNNVFDYSLTNH